MNLLAKVAKATSKIIKIVGFGRSDVREISQVLPYGIDSLPIKDKIGLVVSTQDTGEQVISGYINDNQEVEEGEIKIYSTDSNGDIKISIYLKKSGEILIENSSGTIKLTDSGTIELNGNTDNVVSYTDLNTALQTYVNTMNIQLGTLFSGLGLTFAPVTLNITGAKVDNVKVN